MGTRRRIRARVGRLTQLIEQDKKLKEEYEKRKKQEARNKKKYGELITQIMRMNDCSWTEAKKIHKFEELEKKIAKEFRAMSVNETSNQ